jgi:hypothetical protein
MQDDIDEFRRPPLAPVADLDPVITALGGLGLLTPIRDPDTGRATHIVHPCAGEPMNVAAASRLRRGL